MLEPLGFEAIDPGAMSPAEQVRAFAEAECMVGPHGAGLTNLAFAPAGAAVVELFARDYVNECFWALASTVEGLRYRYLVGDGTPSGPGGTAGWPPTSRSTPARSCACSTSCSGRRSVVTKGARCRFRHVLP